MAGPGGVLLEALFLLLPAYLANMLPVIVGGGRPIDGGRLWRDGRRVLGDGKTWRGLLLAPPLAAGVFVALDRLLPWTFAETPAWAFVFALAMGFGALAGDAFESFLKRRRGKDRGAPWLGFDQLDFVVGAWIFGFAAALIATPLYGKNWFLATFTLPVLAIQLVLTPALHLGVNFFAYKLGKKEVPW